MASAVESFERIEDVRDPEVATDYTKSSGSSAENGKLLWRLCKAWSDDKILQQHNSIGDENTFQVCKKSKSVVSVFFLHSLNESSAIIVYNTRARAARNVINSHEWLLQAINTFVMIVSGYRWQLKVDQTRITKEIDRQWVKYNTKLFWFLHRLILNNWSHLSIKKISDMLNFVRSDHTKNKSLLV